MFRTTSYSFSRQGLTTRYLPKRLYSSSNPPYSTPQPLPLPPKEQKEWEDSMKQQLESPGQESRFASNQDLHPDARKPVAPDFEGDVNPVTGEVGGPKKEPLSWGAKGEWTYGGRATDF